MGAPSCDGCRSWVDDIYWTHFQFLHFAQFLRSGYDQHLALPKTFSDNLKKKLPENVGLKGPGGVVWNIGLTMRDDTLYFMHGWPQFVEDHYLKENDFLVFKYNGESLLDVLIFDGETFCEKAASYFVRKCGHAELGGGAFRNRKDTDNSFGEDNTPSNAGVECVSLEKSVPGNSVRMPAAVPSETPSERTFNAGVECVSPEKIVPGSSIRMPAVVPSETPSEWTFNAGVECVSPEKSVPGSNIRMPADVPFETPSEWTFNAGVESVNPEQFVDADADIVSVPADVPSQTTRKRVRKLVSAVNIVQTKRRGRPSRKAREGVINWVTDSEPASVGKSGTYELYTSNRRPVTENEKNNAFQMAQEACTNDSLCIVMRPTHVYKRFFVSVPNKWILEHISPQSQDVILRMVQNEWLAKYSFHNARHTGGLSGGWKHFAVDNNLEEFDVCVLKPAGHANNNTLIIDVNIFRVVDEITPLSTVNSPGKRGRKKEIRAIQI